MLFLLFRLGKDRYALDTAQIAEIVPLVSIKHIPHAPPGLAGLINYRGTPIPAIDLSQLTLGHAAQPRLSTRIVVMRCAFTGDEMRPLGLIAERATETLRREPSDFAPSGVNAEATPYLGPVCLHHDQWIQWVQADHLLSAPMREVLSAAPAGDS
ncbi:chemotaxis protein CheW [Dyella subtropica]|uniref:chemotaxis protein CheW n=1 Tax=Dyella subtropica TaxID=2992127 RepID=UPI0022530F30|nr:chemotaxis protein CheW [Dyella subtropica]